MNSLPADIGNWDRSRLLESWRSAYGQDPPGHLRTDLLRLAIAWQLQAGPGKRLKPGSGKTAIPLTQGTRLLREWQGKSYVVEITASGYEYCGTTYRSLSAIARLITGTSWSGPAFFGTHR